MEESNREQIYSWINDVEMLTAALQRKDDLLKSFERITEMTSVENDKDDLKEEANVAFRNLNEALKDVCRAVQLNSNSNASVGYLPSIEERNNLEGGKRKKRMTKKRKNRKNIHKN